MKPAWIEALVRMPDRLAASLALGEAFLIASAGERAAVRAGWNFGAEWEYPTPWRLACVRGEKGTSRQRIVAALVLNGLESDDDSREEVLLFGVAYHSAVLAGLDACGIFATVAASLPERAAASLRSFLARAPEDKSLDAFLLEKRTSPDGEVELRQNW